MAHLNVFEQKIMKSALRKSATNLSDLESLGYDAAKNGANTKNCHFSIFSTVERKDAWQRGYDRAKSEQK